ncbi:MAG: hypothetical protein KA092_03085, partial [Bacteroidales bacterium]|nr:hypothetical protein [Bacteroidales bacterium]HNZ47148.1 hypothetical protein [Bacteroidales bacterium]HOG33434.1 hypothetical protein [Bacteroidales bacterium]HQB59024.1 hypothetical protein [Bacteroidales bacterium]
PSRAQKGSPLKSQKARLMKKAISRYLALAFLSVFFTACSSSDQVDIDDQPDYQAYGVYNKTTTLFSYTQYEDQWSVLTYETSYSFRIQNYDQKQVLTISSIPRTVQKGATYTIDVAVYGIDNITPGVKTVTAVRKKDNHLLMYDEENEISYYVYH